MHLADRSCFALCGVLLVLFAVQSESEPAPAEQAAEERLKIVGPVATPASRMADFYTHHFLTYYDMFGEKDAAWDKDARRLISGFSQYLAYDEARTTPTPSGVPSLEELQRQRAAFLESGIEDPLVAYVCAMINPESNFDWKQKDHLIEEYAKQLARDQGKFSCVLPMFLAAERFLAKREVDKGVSSRTYVRRTRVRLVNEYADLFAPDADLRQEDYQPLAELFMWLVDELTAEDAQTLLAAMRDPAEQHRWFAHMLRGLIEYEHGWQARGGGWASSVGEPKWDRFHKHIDKASNEFEAAWKLAPDRALSASWMILISMCRSDGLERMWFDRAVASDPNDPRPYGNWLRASRRMWGGDDQAVLRVGRAALEQGDFRTAVPINFMFALFAIHNDYGNTWLRRHGAAIWPDIQRFVAQKPAFPAPDQPSNWAISEGFWLAHMTGHPKEMGTYIEQLDHDASRLLGGYRYGLDNRWFPGQWATAAEPAVTAAIEEAESHLGRGEFGRAIVALEDSLPYAESPLTSMHLSDRLTVVHWQASYDSGQWVDLFEHGLSGWVLTRGQFEELDPGQGVVGKYRSNQNGPGMRMICGLDPGPGFEAELELTLPAGFRGFTYGGVGFLLEPTIGRGSDRERMVTVRRSHSNSLVWLQDPSHPDDDDRSFGTETNQVLTKVELRMQKWRNRVRLWVDDQLVIDEYEFFGDWPGEDLFAVAAFHGDIDLDYTFHHLRLRKIELSPFGNEPDVTAENNSDDPSSAVPVVPEPESPRGKRPPYGR